MKALIITMFFSIVACATLTFHTPAAALRGLLVPAIPTHGGSSVLSVRPVSRREPCSQAGLAERPLAAATNLRSQEICAPDEHPAQMAGQCHECGRPEDAPR